MYQLFNHNHEIEYSFLLNLGWSYSIKLTAFISLTEFKVSVFYNVYEIKANTYLKKLNNIELCIRLYAQTLNIDYKNWIQSISIFKDNTS